MYTKHLQKAVDSIEKQTLYVVATPIGNLADITLRALAVLQKADIICAEDTRVTAQLLSAYGIQGKLVSVREHNEQQMADKIIAHLSDGLRLFLNKICAFVFFNNVPFVDCVILIVAVLIDG